MDRPGERCLGADLLVLARFNPFQPIHKGSTRRSDLRATFQDCGINTGYDLDFALRAGLTGVVEGEAVGVGDGVGFSVSNPFRSMVS